MAAGSLVPLVAVGILAIFAWFLPFAILNRAQVWYVTGLAIVAGFPYGLVRAWSWKAAMARFDDWDLLDLDERSAA